MPEFDIRDFGAVGDGVHDDGPAFRAAIEAASAAGVGVWIDGGDKVYRIEPA